MNPDPLVSEFRSNCCTNCATIVSEVFLQEFNSIFISDNKTFIPLCVRYQCQVVVSLNNMVTADVELKVKVPPVISEDVPLVKRVTAGDSAELSCDASGEDTNPSFQTIATL